MIFFFEQNDDGYTCHPENIKHGDMEEMGNVCHCYQDKCNTEIPALVTSSTSSSTRSSTSSRTSATKSSFITNSFIVFALFCYFKLSDKVNY